MKGQSVRGGFLGRRQSSGSRGRGGSGTHPRPLGELNRSVASELIGRTQRKGREMRTMPDGHARCNRKPPAVAERGEDVLECFSFGVSRPERFALAAFGIS